jgi:membrane protease YdiL (CAAX protease family)
MPSVPPPQAATEAPPPAAVPPRDAPDELPWKLWVAPAAIVLGLALGQVAVIIIEIIGQAAGSSVSHPTPAVSIISDVAFDLAFVAAALYFAAMHGRPSAAEFGFRRIRFRLGVAAFVLAGAGYYVVTAGYSALFKLHGSDKLPSELGVSKSDAALAAAAVFVCVIAPIAEEFFFRGFFFGVLRRWRIMVFGRNIGTWVAAIVTGILFGLAHTGSASSQYLIPLGFLGFVLCLVRWRTRSLYPCMALHSFNNSLALGVNQLHWSAGAIAALIVGSLVVIAALTGPLSARPVSAAP